MTDLQEGVWVKITYQSITDNSTPTIDGFARSTGGMVAIWSPQHAHVSQRLIAPGMVLSIEPAPMPKPPDGSILEWIEPGHVEPYLAHRIGAEWFRTGVAWPVDWSDLGLGTPECPVHVVRWGAR